MMRYLLGIDCATEPRKVGLAIGKLCEETRRCSILDVRLADTREPPGNIAVRWIMEYQPALLALDAPLGWPQALGQTLANHVAGQSLRASPDEMFHRYTDDQIQERFNKRPLEVGANLIARTARAALGLLMEIRGQVHQEIPLAWQRGVPNQLSAIEVYPAATMQARGLPLASYSGKKEDRIRARKELIIALREQIALGPHEEFLAGSADAIDAVTCVLAGADFLLGDAVPPPHDEQERVTREGWIWVR